MPGRRRDGAAAPRRRMLTRTRLTLATAACVVAIVARARVGDATATIARGEDVDADARWSNASGVERARDDARTARLGTTIGDATGALAEIWEHYETGRHARYKDVGRSRGVGSVGVNKASSVWVREGYRLRLWDGSGRTGDSATLYGGYTNLAYWTFNDAANDVDVETVAPCTLFSADRGRGIWFDAADVGRGYHSTDLGAMNDNTDSVYVAPGYKCTVWADNFEGKSLTFYPGWHLYHELNHEGMRDKISSVRAENAPSGYDELAENALALAWEHYQGHSGSMQVYDSEGESLGVADAGG